MYYIIACESQTPKTVPPCVCVYPIRDNNTHSNYLRSELLNTYTHSFIMCVSAWSSCGVKTNKHSYLNTNTHKPFIIHALADTL